MAAYMLIAGASGYTDTLRLVGPPAGACAWRSSMTAADYDAAAGLLAPVPDDGRR